MCGICGIISTNIDKKPSKFLVEKMKNLLNHRGPDFNGTYMDDTAILGHTRLSIIDLSENGNQPMTNENESLWIVFNGELYNYQELKTKLKNKGHLFKSNSDTEVILHAYEEWDIGCLERFNGAFSFVIWNKETKKIFAARDNFGEKPFFYYYDNDFFYFSSELYPLINALETIPKINPIGLDLFLSYLFIPAPHTIFKNIYQLQPANYLIIDNDGDLKINYFWNLNLIQQEKHSPETMKSKIKELLLESVSLRLNSDVPIGVLLSGGIDSAVIIALMNELNFKEITTFSIGTSDPKMDELARARIISKLFKTQHNEYIVRPNAIDVLPKLIKNFGQPYADSSAIPTYYVTNMASKNVKVVLSGDGGDEMFAGYNRYKIGRYLDIFYNLPKPLRKLFLNNPLMDCSFIDQTLKRKFDYFKSLTSYDIDIAFASSFSQGFNESKSLLYNSNFLDLLGNNNAIKIISSNYLSSDAQSIFDKWIHADIRTMLAGDYLTKVDISSMLNSIEVRVPFLDRKLAEYLASIPSTTKMENGQQKALLKSIFKNVLPEDTLTHKKTGFSIPVHHWLQNELSVYVDKFILEGKSEIIDTYLNKKYIHDISIKQRNGDNSLTSKVWAIFNLVLWERLIYKNEYAIDIKITDF